MQTKPSGDRRGGGTKWAIIVGVIIVLALIIWLIIAAV